MNGIRILCVHLPSASVAQAEALAEACLRFSSQVALRRGHAGPSAVLLEAGRSGWLYAPEGLAARVRVAAQRLGLPEPWRLGWGDNAAEAYAQARWGQALLNGDAERLPLEALQAYASPFMEHVEAEHSGAELHPCFPSTGPARPGRLSWRCPCAVSSRASEGRLPLLRQRVAGHWDMAWPRFEPVPGVEELADTRQVETQDGISAGRGPALPLEAASATVSAPAWAAGACAPGACA